jgi:hypothetical protein
MAAVLVALVGVAATAVAQSVPHRVDTAAALKQVVTKVDPVWTQALVEANPGALVAADVIVTPTGTVESVSVLVGPDALRPAFVAAVRQWTFRPFLSGGRPVRAVVMIDHQLRNPKEEQLRKAADDFRDAFDRCQARIEARAPDAIPTCQKAVQLSESLDPDRRIERSHAASMLGVSLLMADRAADALIQFEKGLSYRQRTNENDTDADSATLRVFVARAHAAMGNLEKADAELTEAVATLRRAIAALPSFKTRYSQVLDDVLREQAGLKAAMGKTDDAKALQQAAGQLNAPARGRPMPPMTRAGSLLIGGAIGPQLNADDLQQIRALMPAGKTPWLLLASAEFDGRWEADVFLAPDVRTSTYRRGQVVSFLGRVTTTASGSQSRKWEAPGMEWPFVQVPVAGRDMDQIRGADDPSLPVTVPMTAGEPMSDDEVVTLITFLREAGARSAGTPAAHDLRTTVQPWPIHNVIRWPDGRVEARLRDGATVDGRTQRVTLRRDGSAWTIVKLEPW